MIRIRLLNGVTLEYERAQWVKRGELGTVLYADKAMTNWVAAIVVGGIVVEDGPTKPKVIYPKGWDVMTSRVNGWREKQIEDDD